ncbi:hypothetical protein L2E82_17409 [Cichorium intybus]|uniref:Uncharacterized protein n=1 Tax=Cichorium intybus TaxID=13427 RepID=A0ACB9F888_CICIN|nr:hypothetical protein L2E82_17409 [Cichorium intybus]
MICYKQFSFIRTLTTCWHAHRHLHLLLLTPLFLGVKIKEEKELEQIKAKHCEIADAVHGDSWLLFISFYDVVLRDSSPLSSLPLFVITEEGNFCSILLKGEQVAQTQKAVADPL